MGERKFTLGNIHVLLRPGSPRLRLAVVGLILCALLALGALFVVSSRIHAGTAELLDKAAELEGEISRMEDRIENAGTPQVVQDIAGEELGLVDPDTVIISPDSQ